MKPCVAFLDPYQLLDTTSEGVVVADSVWRCLYANSAARRMLDRSAAEIDGVDLRQLLPRPAAQQCGTTFDRALDEAVGTGRRLAWWSPGTLGGRRFELQAQRRDEQLIVCIRSEDTETQVGLPLLRSSEIAQLLVDASTGRVFEANDAAEQLYRDTSCHPLVGLGVGEIVQGPSADSARPRVHEALSAPGRAGTHLRTRSDRPVDIEVHATPVTLGDQTFVHWLMVDASERVRAEGRLRDANELLSTLVQNSPLALIVTDPDTKVMMWNAEAARVFGWTAEEVKHQPLPIVPEDRQVEWHRALAPSADGGRATTSLETRAVRRDGSPVDVLLSTAELRSPDGRTSSIVSFMFDVTERRKLESQFRAAQKMEAVGRLAGGVAHDFNNLLMTIRGYSDSLIDEMSPSDPRRESVNEIQRAADRATVMTQQLLAFSRQQVLQPTILDLNVVVRDMERLLRRLIDSNIEFRVELESALGAVRADAGQLGQVLMNLCVNSRDAMPLGGSIGVATRNVQVAEGAVRGREFVIPAGDYIVLEVRDTGSGMSQETLARVFEPFYSTKTEQGTGLGMATVYGIVKQSNGFILVDSALGEGTIVRVYLPQAAVSAPRTALPIARPTVAGGSETIMLVEDEDSLRKLICRMLECRGYRMLSARNGAAALQICQDHVGPIDLLVTDVVMPEMGGRELAERLAILRPETSVCFMSGYTSDEVVRRGLFDERLILLQKPLSPATLAARIREILDARAREKADPVPRTAVTTESGE